MSKRSLMVVALLASLAGMAGAQSQPTRYYSRQHLSGMFINPTTRQLVGHPYWGCLPSQPYGFNADYYGAINPDVVEAGYPLYQHYVDYGRSEGRLPCDPSGSSTYNPGDSYTRILPRAGTNSYVATASHDRYSLPYNMGGATAVIDGFDVANDTLGLGWIEPQAGIPQFVDLGNGLGTELRWNGVAVIRLVGVSVADAMKLEQAGRTVTS